MAFPAGDLERRLIASIWYVDLHTSKLQEHLHDLFITTMNGVMQY
jgi:hypothetical protein